MGSTRRPPNSRGFSQWEIHAVTQGSRLPSLRTPASSVQPAEEGRVRAALGKVYGPPGSGVHRFPTPTPVFNWPDSCTWLPPTQECLGRVAACALKEEDTGRALAVSNSIFAQRLSEIINH